LAYDPLVARFFIFLSKLLNFLARLIFCQKFDSGSPPSIIEATSNSSPNMLTLSIHLNNLFTWAISVFTVSLTSNQLASSVPYYLTITGIDAALSCISGFFISCYLIKKLQEALSL
jgi:hypothetical protein